MIVLILYTCVHTQVTGTEASARLGRGIMEQPLTPGERRQAAGPLAGTKGRKGSRPASVSPPVTG